MSDHPPGLPVGIALGANLGDREASLSRALHRLDHLSGLMLLATSPLVESEPWGDTDQPPFLNAAVVGRYAGTATALLSHLQEIERDLGKQVLRHWGPRIIDLDLLFVGEERVADASLRLPHPRIADRPFVHVPLRRALAAADLPPSYCPTPSAAGVAIEADTRVLPPAERWPIAADASDSRRGVLSSIEQTHHLAAAIAQWIRPGDQLAVDGPLGAGKSELCRAVLRSLGVTDRIASPTFTLCRQYQHHGGSAEHWDFYRIGSLEELEAAGWGERWSSAAPVIFAEWAPRFPEAFAADALCVTLEPIGDDARLLTMHRDGGLPLVLRAFPLGPAPEPRP